MGEESAFFLSPSLTGRLYMTLGPFRSVGKGIIGQWKQGGEVFQAVAIPNLTLRHNSISPLALAGRPGGGGEESCQTENREG